MRPMNYCKQHGLHNCMMCADKTEVSESPELFGSIASPWPAKDIVAKLVEAVNILLDDKSYDGHGWELIQGAKTEADKWLKQ